MTFLSSMNRCLRCFIDGRLVRYFIVHPPLGDLLLRPQPAEWIPACVDVPLRDQEVRVFAAPEVEDGERMSCNLCDTSPRPATAALTAS